jgi:hypothetical protein
LKVSLSSKPKSSLELLIIFCNYEQDQFLSWSFEEDQFFKKSGANVIRKLTTAIHGCCMVILSFCFIKIYYLGNYLAVAIIFHDICETNAIKHNLTKSENKILLCFKHVKSVDLGNTKVIYCSIVL